MTSFDQYLGRPAPGLLTSAAAGVGRWGSGWFYLRWATCAVPAGAVGPGPGNVLTALPLLSAVLLLFRGAGIGRVEVVFGFPVFPVVLTSSGKVGAGAIGPTSRMVSARPADWCGQCVGGGKIRETGGTAAAVAPRRSPRGTRRLNVQQVPRFVFVSGAGRLGTFTWVQVALLVRFQGVSRVLFAR